MKKKERIFLPLMSAALITASLISCDKKDDDILDVPAIDLNATILFNVVLSTSTTGNTETYVQALDNIEEGKISFNNYGFEIPSTRTARVYASQDGKTLYNLNYGGGTILNYAVKGLQQYDLLHETNVAPIIGTEYPRWTKLNDQNALLHNVKTENVYANPADESSKYKYTESKTSLANIDLATMAVKDYITFETPTSDEDKTENFYISRIDAPAILNGKAYYGVTKAKRNPEKPTETLKGIVYQATSLVVDYPSLKHPKVISSTLTTGSTYGYRVPVSHVYNNAIYQISSTGMMLKLKDGAYDDSYIFDISKSLGFDVGTLGWFHVADGIGYCTFYDKAKGNSEEAAAWGVARVDLNTKTAIKMDLPDKLYLFQYQMAKAVAGKLYMALAPIGSQGRIYIFDSKDATSKGFKEGASIETGAGASYIGIF
jgi:hypothetical protein